ncbi:uncharacterized protein LOC127952921 [Carassius gibelio]|uniref:uncharacterized protein LOC127952921 n=1 Tax=Carassius gibelio TaxID=101364 RepID=UPI00227941FA|nr:uncharacterized protein LOC127952921 [Carassius gibelio]
MSSLQIFIFLLVVLCLTNFVASADVIKYKGDNFTMTFPAPQKEALGVYLYSRSEISREVFYYFFQTKKLTVHKDFEGRVGVKYDEKTLTIDIINLRLRDAGAYWCTCNRLQGECQMDDKGPFLLVHEPVANVASSKSADQKSGGINELMILVMAITAGSVLLLLLLVFGVWLVPKIKKQMRSKEKGEKERRCNNGVYEVMTVHRKAEFA